MGNGTLAPSALRAAAVGFIAAFAAVPAAGVDATDALERIRQAGINKGLICVLESGSADLLSGLAADGGFLVHAIEPDRETMEAMQAAVDKGGRYGKRIIVETGQLGRLPYGGNVVDAILAPSLTDLTLGQYSSEEMIRSLRPGGVAILTGGDLSRGSLDAWLDATGAVRTDTDNGVSVLTTLEKREPGGIDIWSHWERAPDNNPVSNDSVIRAPYMTQYLGLPYYIAMPAISVAAGGRLFTAMGHIAHHRREEPWLNTLLARNGYNGTVLWQRKLPDGYLVHRSAFIATRDVFYMIDVDGSGCLMLNPETGDELGRIEIPGLGGEWKWIAMDDGVLYVLAGEQKDPAETTVVRSEITHWSWGELSRGYYEKRVPWGFGQTLAAYDMESGALKWTRSEEAAIDSRAMTMGGGRVYIYMPDSHLACLSAETGEVIWTNEDAGLRELIEEPGQGLQSTPGFRTMCYSVRTPKALFFEAQTRMNLVAVSLEDGSYLWHKRKTTNNPNVIYVDGDLIAGIGPEGNTLAIDPLTGEIKRDLGFKKRSCARLTATPDSFFCRGWPEGLTRFDRETGNVLFNGAFRPSCNDGVLPAHGLLYAGPWACDCNLTLMGAISLASAQDRYFDKGPEMINRRQTTKAMTAFNPSLETDGRDWPAYRGGVRRAASGNVPVEPDAVHLWEFVPEAPFTPTAPTAAGGLIFYGGDDGKIRALDAASGRLEWTFRTAGAVLQPPAVVDGRAFVGSGDGYVYALDAAGGELLWKFHAAPFERRIMVYGSLGSTWPVHGGVAVHDGVVYAAGGVIDYDGTYIVALNAETGGLIWENRDSGHLDKALRKGISAQGFLTVHGGKLWMPGGNVVSPAVYDTSNGAYLGAMPGDGSPKTNRGEEIGVFGDMIIQGGRLRFSAAQNVVNPGQLIAFSANGGSNPPFNLNQGKIPPAWNERYVAAVNGRNTPLQLFSAEDVRRAIQSGEMPDPLWTAAEPREGDTVSVVLADNAAVTVAETPRFRSLSTGWKVFALDTETGKPLWSRNLPGPAQPGALSIDRGGRAVVCLEDGRVTAIGGMDSLKSRIEAEEKSGGDVKSLLQSQLNAPQSPAVRGFLVSELETRGGRVGERARRNGYIADWRLWGPVDWNRGETGEPGFAGLPSIDTGGAVQYQGKTLSWNEHQIHRPDGLVDLDQLFGYLENKAVYAYAEPNLPPDTDLQLHLGSNDGFVCWFNGEEVDRFDGGRAYAPGQNVIPVKTRKGANAILVKIAQLGAQWGFSVQVTGADGTPADLTEAGS